MLLNTRQEKIVKATENNILCLAPSGSGKTKVITERIKDLILNKGVKPQDIVSITFTNQAAQEMMERLVDIPKGVFIGTIHSYANLICQKNRLDTQQYIAREQFDKILERALTLPQYRFPFVKHLLIDECQDISSIDYNFLININTENIFWVGDDRQMIYSFRGSNADYIQNLFKDIECKKYYLKENYRTAPNIISFAEDFLSSSRNLSPNSIPIKQKNGILEECSLMEAIEEMEINKDWSSWAILVRTNEELAFVQEILIERKIPNITFKRGDMDLKELKEKLISNSVKVLTIHSAKGLEFNRVITVGAKLFSEEERRISYVAATRAKNALYWCPVPKGIRKKRKKKNNFDGVSGVIEF